MPKKFQKNDFWLNFMYIPIQMKIKEFFVFQSLIIHGVLLLTLADLFNAQEEIQDSISGIKLPSRQNVNNENGLQQDGEPENKFELASEAGPKAHSGDGFQMDSESSTLLPGDGINGCLLRCKDDHMMKVSFNFSHSEIFKVKNL